MVSRRKISTPSTPPSFTKFLIGCLSNALLYRNSRLLPLMIKLAFASLCYALSRKIKGHRRAKSLNDTFLRATIYKLRAIWSRDTITIARVRIVSVVFRET